MNKKANPTIEQLQDSNNYELLAELNHNTIKEFVINQISRGGILVTSYMIYQGIMMLFGIFILTKSIIIAYNDNYLPLILSVAALVFSFSFMVILHELIHGLAIKTTGAPNINYGAYFKRFIFYAEADRYVLNRKQFTLIALAPLVVIKAVTLLGVVLFFHHPIVYFFSLLMSVHSLFCAGDIGLLTLFYQNKDSEVYTYDVRSEKKSYYFRNK